MGISKTNARLCDICNEIDNRTRKVEMFLTRNNELKYFCEVCVHMLYLTFNEEKEKEILEQE